MKAPIESYSISVIISSDMPQATVVELLQAMYETSLAGHFTTVLDTPGQYTVTFIRSLADDRDLLMDFLEANTDLTLGHAALHQLRVEIAEVPDDAVFKRDILNELDNLDADDVQWQRQQKVSDLQIINIAKKHMEYSVMHGFVGVPTTEAILRFARALLALETTP